METETSNTPAPFSTEYWRHAAFDLCKERDELRAALARLATDQILARVNDGSEEGEETVRMVRAALAKVTA